MRPHMMLKIHNFSVEVWRWKACLQEAAAFYRVIIRAETSAWRRVNHYEHLVYPRKKAVNLALVTITDPYK